MIESSIIFKGEGIAISPETEKSGAARGVFRPGELLEVRPEKLVAGGAALARHERAVIFIEGLYPGDLARVRIESVAKGFIRAVAVELVEPSPFRRLAPCPVAETCGGCDWTSLRLDVQLEAKRSILREALVRTGRIPADEIPAITMHPSPLRYRLRGRLHWSDAGRVGFFARRTNEVVPLPDECELLPKEVIASARAEPPGKGTRSFYFDGESVVWADELDGLPVSLQVDGLQWDASTSTFLQANRHLLGKLIRSILATAAVAGEDRGLALDLYGGAGFFALPLAGMFGRVITVEGNPEATEWARRNAERTRSVEVVSADVSEWLASFRETPDFVLLDPPRAGLAASVVSDLDRLRPRRVSYLSCDPVTFARDVGRFRESGWALRSLEIFDLFPNTHHVETLGLLERA